MMQVSLSIAVEHWPIRGSFTISRGSKTEAAVVVVTLTDGAYSGRGECVPYARYGETVESVVTQIESLRPQLEAGLDRAALQQALPAGAARNAIDCAMWGLESRRAGRSVAALAGLPEPQPVLTAYTISLDTPEVMAARARDADDYPLLKLKLGVSDVVQTMQAVRAARPHAKLIVDANESWPINDLPDYLKAAYDCGIEMIEQPLPAGKDAALADIAHPVVLCADESAHTWNDLVGLKNRYEAVNLKLDKTGGLTEALATKAEAERLGFKIMIGCMVSTSLAIAPAFLLTAGAAWVDLDGPLLLERDRAGGVTCHQGILRPPTGM